MFRSNLSIVIFILYAVRANILKPQIYQQTFKEHHFNVRSQSHTEIDFNNASYVINVNLKERKNSPKVNISSAMQNYTKEFEPSHSCKVVDPQASLELITIETLGYQVLKYYYWQHQGKAYVIILQKKGSLLFYEVNNISKNRITVNGQMKSENFVLIDTIQKDTLDNKFELFFVETEDKLFLTNGINIYQISIKKNKFELIEKKHLSQTESKQEVLESIRHVLALPNSTIFVLFQKSYFFYQFDNSTENFKSLNLSNKQPFLQFENGQFVDAAVFTNNLYLLNNVEGIVKITNYHPLSKQNQQAYKFPFKMGNHESLRVFGQILQIVCKYEQRKFVAQFSDQYTSLQLNRFYHRISGVHDTLLIKTDLFVIGQQIHVYGPGVNSNILKEMQNKEFPYVFSNFKQSEIFANKLDSQNQSIRLIGVGQNSISILEFKKVEMKISCQIQQSTQIIIELQSVCCNQAQCQRERQPIKEICKSIFPVEFEFRYQINQKQAILISFVISAGIFVIGIGIIAILINCMVRSSKKHYQQISQLSLLIKEKGVMMASTAELKKDIMQQKKNQECDDKVLQLSQK